MRDFSFSLAPGEEAVFATKMEYTIQNPVLISDRYQSRFYGHEKSFSEKPVLGLRTPHLYFATRDNTSVRFFVQLKEFKVAEYWERLTRSAENVNGIKPTNLIEIQLDPLELPTFTKDLKSALDPVAAEEFTREQKKAKAETLL